MTRFEFRAWDPVNKEMLDANTGCFFYEEDNGFHCGYKAGPDAPADVAGDWVDCPMMQYTGLRDKNGTKIFEKDVLVSDEYPFHSDGHCNYRGAVEWFAEDGCWCLELFAVSDRVRGATCGGPLSEYASHCEVVGNSYENPELLEAV